MGEGQVGEVLSVEAADAGISADEKAAVAIGVDGADHVIGEAVEGGEVGESGGVAAGEASGGGGPDDAAGQAEHAIDLVVAEAVGAGQRSGGAEVAGLGFEEGETAAGPAAAAEASGA